MSSDGAKKQDTEQPSALSPEVIQDLNLQVVRSPSVSQPSPNLQMTPAHPPILNQVVHARQTKAAEGGNSPDEELSTFFQQRRLASQGPGFLFPILASLGKLLVVILVVSAVFVFFWNHVAVVRVNAQALGIRKLGFNIAEHIPAWSKKAKKFREQNTTELGEFYSRGGKSTDKLSEVSRNPSISAVVQGYWPMVENSAVKNCTKWQVSSNCAIRAWYLAYKGSRASLKPIASMDLASIETLSKTEQALFVFAMSQAVIGQRSDQLFDESLKRAAFDKDLQRVIFDAKVKNIIRENQLIMLPRMVGQSSQIALQPADSLKWRALEWAAKIRNQSARPDKNTALLARKQIAELLGSAQVVVKWDPVGFLMLADPALRLGLSKDIKSVAESIITREKPRDFDPGLYREISTVLIRAQMMQGQLADAVKRARELHKQLGPDATSSHLLGSALLAGKMPSQAGQAVQAFQIGMSGQNFWQSQLGYFLALTKSGQFKEADVAMKKLQKIRTSTNSLWIRLAIADYKLAVGKTVPDLPMSYFKQVAMDLAPIYAAKPNWPTVAELYAEAVLRSGKSDLAVKVQAHADQLAGRARYLDSEEYLESPLGPFALLR